ncbi:hypothetical protein LLH03_12230 [bacterium]|nr:hypothetical protein [bacterium]
MYRRVGLLCILTLTLGALPGFSADVSLRYKMAKGEMLRYQCTTTGTGSVTMLDKIEPLNMTAEFTYVMTCTALDTSGNMTIVNRIEDLKTTATLSGQALPVSLQIPVITTVMSPTGTIVSTKVERVQQAGTPATGAPDVLQQMQFDVGQFFGDLRGPGFPAEPLHPGSRWQEVLNLTTQAGEKIPLQYTTTLLDYVQLEGRECVRLQTDYQLPLNLSLVAGNLFNLSGKQTGSQIGYFDYQRGRMMRFDGTSDSEMTMALPQLFGAGSGGQQAVKMTLRSVTSVVLQGS